MINRGILCFAAVLLLALPVAAQSGLRNVIAVPTARTLKLEDGAHVWLAAIQIPNPARNGTEQDEPLSQQAHSVLQGYALNKAVRLEPIGEGTDRRGRVVAMVYEEDKSLQAAMVREGLAWVYTFEDAHNHAPALLAAEREAEKARRGVWANADYAVQSPEEAAEHIGEFRLVKGKVVDVAELRGRYYLNFGSDWRTDFTLLIDKDVAKNFDPAWVSDLSGKTIRARGWLFEKNGPAIALSHPEQVEIMHEETVDIGAADLVLRN